MGLKIVWNDILSEKADAIVTPASRFPRVGVGLDKFVHAAAGPGLLEARKKLGIVGPGRLCVTKAFGLAEKTGAKWVIHALGPIWNKKLAADQEHVLAGSYFRIFCKAAELKCRSVATPALSSGKFGMPMASALRVAVATAQEFLAAFPKLEIKIVGIDADFRDAAREHWFDFYVPVLDAKGAEAARAAFGGREYDAHKDSADALAPGEVDPYFEKRLIEKEVAGKSFKQIFQLLWRRVADEERARKRKHKGVGKYLITQDDLSRATLISPRTIRNYCTAGAGSVSTSKDKAVAIAVALGVSVPYAEALLDACKFKFDNTERDEFVYDWIENRRGAVAELNDALECRGLAPLDVGEVG